MGSALERPDWREKKLISCPIINSWISLCSPKISCLFRHRGSFYRCGLTKSCNCYLHGSLKPIGSGVPQGLQFTRWLANWLSMYGNTQTGDWHRALSRHVLPKHGGFLASEDFAPHRLNLLLFNYFWIGMYNFQSIMPPLSTKSFTQKCRYPLVLLLWSRCSYNWSWGHVSACRRY